MNIFHFTQNLKLKYTRISEINKRLLHIYFFHTCINIYFIDIYIKINAV